MGSYKIKTVSERIANECLIAELILDSIRVHKH